MDSILNCKKITKKYSDAGVQRVVLDNLDLELKKAEKIAIKGRSGAGKSTLLNLLSAIDRVDGGQIYINGKEIAHAAEDVRESARNNNIGVILQDNHLLTEFNVLENTIMPLLIRGENILNAQEAGKNLLAELGLAEYIYSSVNKLSGGQKQRVAIARGFIAKPSFVVADEPTGSLDQITATEVFKLMLNMSEQHKIALIVVTHDHKIASMLDKVYELNNGKLSLS